METAPYLVTLAMDAETWRQLQALRTQYFPAERNQVPAHLSLFHHLPPSDEVKKTLAEVSALSQPFSIHFKGLKRLSGGMMVSVVAPELLELHQLLSARFAPWLTPQDRQPYSPHVTLMNKASKEAAISALESLSQRWSAFEGTGEGLLLWRYLGGPWEEVCRYPFQV